MDKTKQQQLESVLNSLYVNFQPLKYSSRHWDKMLYDSFVRDLNEIAKFHRLPALEESSKPVNGAQSQMTLCAIYDTIVHELPSLVDKDYSDFAIRQFNRRIINLFDSHGAMKRNLTILYGNPWEWADKDDKPFSLFTLETTLIEDGSLEPKTQLNIPSIP